MSRLRFTCLKKMPAPDQNDFKPVLKVLVMGYGYLAEGLLSGVLQACQDKKHAIELIGFFPWTATAKGRHYSDAGHHRCMRLAKQACVPLIEYPSVNEYSFSAYLQQAQPDIVLVGSWGEILKPHLVKTDEHQATPQFINCHPALLPAHRGANPYASCIIEGETQSGVTFHVITEAIDAGAIYVQAIVPISDSETGDSLRQKCSDKARELVPELLAGVIEGTLLPKNQDESQSSYYPLLHRALGQLDFTKPPADLERLLRALTPWMKPYGTIRTANKLIKEVFICVEAMRRVSKSKCSKSLFNHASLFEVGAVLAVQGRRLWVQSSEDNVILELSVYQVYTRQFEWLPLVSGVVLPLSVRAGDYFEWQVT